MVEIKKGLVFAGVSPITKKVSKYHNEIIKIENKMVTVAQYNQNTEDKIINFTLNEIKYMFKRGLAILILER